MKGAGLPCRNGHDILGIEKEGKKLSECIRVSIKDGAGRNAGACFPGAMTIGP